ncbi:MAG: GNAT family N-acetyltransferase [Sulfuritalea sp.]|nr:GNAT family N-acetyltransferase [Sulfuritalea sp.]
MSARQPWAAELMEFRLRSAEPEDRSRVSRFLAAMDREGLYMRHFAHGEAPNLALLDRIDALDQRDRVAVLAVGHDGEVLGQGEYVAEHGAAEFAFMVLPRHRVRGIGTALLRALLDIGTAAGVTRMHGMIQASNRRALQLVRKNGFRVVRGDDATVVIVSRDLTPGSEARPEQAAKRYPLPFICHDSDRTPLHRRPGPRAPLRAGGR